MHCRLSVIYTKIPTPTEFEDLNGKWWTVFFCFFCSFSPHISSEMFSKTIADTKICSLIHVCLNEAHIPFTSAFKSAENRIKREFKEQNVSSKMLHPAAVVTHMTFICLESKIKRLALMFWCVASMEQGKMIVFLSCHS